MLLTTSRSCSSIWRTIWHQILEARAGKAEITTALESEKADIADVKERSAALVTSQAWWKQHQQRPPWDRSPRSWRRWQMQRRCSSRRRAESRERRTHWCRKFWVLVDRQRQISEVSCWGWRKSLCVRQFFGPAQRNDLNDWTYDGVRRATVTVRTSMLFQKTIRRWRSYISFSIHFTRFVTEEDKHQKKKINEVSDTGRVSSQKLMITLFTVLQTWKTHAIFYHRRLSALKYIFLIVWLLYSQCNTDVVQLLPGMKYEIWNTQNTTWLIK